jgi:hypothetical protein
MFDQTTALIVGAGASIDYGLPSGRMLLSNVIQAVNNSVQSFHAFNQENVGATIKDYAQAVAFEDPKSASLFDALDDSKISIHKLNEYLRTNLVHGNLDDFVRDNPTTLKPIKALIASHLFESLYERADAGWRLRDRISRRQNLYDDDWIREFVGLARAHLKIVPERPMLNIVSFNYDFVLEYSIRKYWAAAEVLLPDIDICANFIYPHGSFSRLPQTIVDARSYLKEQMEQIRIGSDANPIAHKTAALAIANAKLIYFVGFSFVPSNVALLGLTTEAGMKMRVQNFERKDYRLERAVRALGIRQMTDDGSMINLVRNGFFEPALV